MSDLPTISTFYSYTNSGETVATPVLAVHASISGNASDWSWHGTILLSDDRFGDQNLGLAPRVPPARPYPQAPEPASTPRAPDVPAPARRRSPPPGVLRR